MKKAKCLRYIDICLLTSAYTCRSKSSIYEFNAYNKQDYKEFGRCHHVHFNPAIIEELNDNLTRLLTFTEKSIKIEIVYLFRDFI